MESALEELSTVGSVSVDRHGADKPACGYEYTVKFQPWVDDTLPHILNYGDLPDIVVRGTGGASRVTPFISNMLDPGARFTHANSHITGTFPTVLTPPLSILPSCPLSRWRRGLLLTRTISPQQCTREERTATTGSSPATDTRRTGRSWDHRPPRLTNEQESVRGWGHPSKATTMQPPRRDSAARTAPPPERLPPSSPLLPSSLVPGGLVMPRRLAHQVLLLPPSGTSASFSSVSWGHGLRFSRAFRPI